MRRLFVAGNWKMNLTSQSSAALAAGIAQAAPSGESAVDVVICPAFPYLQTVGTAIAGSSLSLGAQDVYFEEPGAFTGEVSAEMLVDVGCQWVILGHSERRHLLGEDDELISRKVSAALKAEIGVILCVGELLSQRESHQTEAVLDRQLAGSLGKVDAEGLRNMVIAYEPVWAIGTGVTATPEQAESAHTHVRNWLARRYNTGAGEALSILYGGSVKPDNAAILLSQPNIDGVLVGGASLEIGQFSSILEAARQMAADPGDAVR